MGLAIDGNVVHGIARGGQAFLPIDTQNSNSITYNGQQYIDLANASLNLTKIGSDDQFDYKYTDDTTVDFTIGDFKNFLEYSFYQIMIIDLSISENFYRMSDPFSIKSNVRMTIPAADSFTFNVLADNSGIHISFKAMGSNDKMRIIFYGYK